MQKLQMIDLISDLTNEDVKITANTIFAIPTSEGEQVACT
jgi:hypothetical protein